MTRIKCVFTQRRTITGFEFKLIQDSTNDEEDEVSMSITTPIDMTAIGVIECPFEPVVELIEYEVEVMPTNDHMTARVKYILSTQPVKWSEIVCGEICIEGGYREGETFTQFMARAGTLQQFQFRAHQWIQWTKFCWLLDVFGASHYDHQVVDYIRQEQLLTVPLKEWFGTVRARQCPWRIQTEVIRVVLEDDPVVDEIAAVEELKWAMKYHRSVWIRGDQILRVHEFCTDVMDALQALANKEITVLNERGETSFREWSDPPAGEPVNVLEYYIRRLLTPPKPIAPSEGVTRYQSLELHPDAAKQKRIWIRNEDYNAIKELCITRKVERVFFVFGYACHPRRLMHYQQSQLGWSKWKCLRSKTDAQTDVFMDHRTIHKTKRTRTVISDLSRVGGEYYYHQAMRMGEEVIPVEILKWCDIVFFMAKKNTPRQWLDYLDRMCQTLCVVGEMPVATTEEGL